MSRVHISEELPASAEQIWSLIGDFGGVLAWSGPELASCEVEGQGVGAIRTLGMQGGFQVREKLEAHDPTERSFSYSFEGKSPLPIRDYYATMRVSEISASRCRLEWTGSFEPAGMEEAQAIAILSGIYNNGIGNLRQKFAG